MKILLISNTYWNFYNFRNKLIKILSKKNKIFLSANKDKFISLFPKNITKNEISMKKNNISIFQDIFFFKTYLKLIKDIKPNLILSFTVKPNLASIILSKIFKIPIIITVSGLGTLYLKHKIFFKIYLFLFRIFMHKKAVIYFHNREDLNIYKKNKIINKTFFSKVISGSGVDFNKFKRVKIDLKKNNFLFVGRLIKDKGINELIDAINKIRKKNIKTNFTLIGNLDVNNPQSINIDKLNELKKDKSLMFKKFSKNIINDYSHNSCLILPSYREGLSKSLIEAMYCGLPIITTNVPGCQYVVKKSKCGYVAKVKNSTSLIEKILKFINLSVSKKKVMSTNAHNYAKNNFNEQNIINEYLNAIKKIS